MKKRLSEVRSTDSTTDKLLALAHFYLERSEQVANPPNFIRNRQLGVADALVHAAEHQQHIREKTGPSLPPKEDASRHLERVYFRVQQAAFFPKQSPDPNAFAIAEFARRYYDQARAANDRGDTRVADECANSAEDLVRALEDLAQAAAPPVSRR